MSQWNRNLYDVGYVVDHVYDTVLCPFRHLPRPRCERVLVRGERGKRTTTTTKTEAVEEWSGSWSGVGVAGVAGVAGIAGGTGGTGGGNAEYAGEEVYEERWVFCLRLARGLRIEDVQNHGGGWLVLTVAEGEGEGEGEQGAGDGQRAFR